MKKEISFTSVAVAAIACNQLGPLHFIFVVLAWSALNAAIEAAAEWISKRKAK